MNRRHASIFLGLIIILLATCFAAVLFGGSDIDPRSALRILTRHESASVEASIIWKIRLPRIFLGLIVGSGLAAAGAALQGMLRNPLADPYTLGVSGGAALGATLAIVIGLSVVWLPVFAFTGALICIYTVYAVASRRKFSVTTIVLCGVILSFLFSSLTMLVLALARSRKAYEALLWLMGDLGSCDEKLLALVGVLTVVGIGISAFYGKHLNILTLGEEKAMYLGVNAERVKKILFAVTSIITGACVASCGIIGFVGLIVPHVMRFIGGPDHRFLIPASALAGGAFLVLCDTVARTALSPFELPVGVITGIIGGLFFMGYILSSKRTEIF